MRAILFAVILLLGAIVAAEWQFWKPDSPVIEVRQPPPDPRGEAASFEARDYSLPPLDHYQKIEERPLFVEGRRPIEEEQQEAPPPPPPPPPKPKTPAPAIDLRGIMIIGNERIALLGRAVEKDGPTRLRKGDQIRDWTVSEITDEKIVLSNGAEHTSVELRKFSSVPLPAIPAAKQAPGKPPGAPGAINRRNDGTPPARSPQRQ